MAGPRADRKCWRASRAAIKPSWAQVAAGRALIALALSLAIEQPDLGAVQAVTIQRLNVPDLVVIDQQQNRQQQQQQLLLARAPAVGLEAARSSQSTAHNGSGTNQPEAASLINNQDLSVNEHAQQHQLQTSAGQLLQQQSQIAFECQISFDKTKDKNLIVKWHHDDRAEPIYQWIPELNKRSIANAYRAYIVPTVSAPAAHGQQQQQQFVHQAGSPDVQSPAAVNQTQLLEAGFKLIHPSKELGAPPRAFRFNASRTEIWPRAPPLASQSHRDRLMHLNQQQQQQPMAPNEAVLAANQQLPLPYRIRVGGGSEAGLGSTPYHQASTPGAQAWAPADYVNVQRSRYAAGATAPAALAANQAPAPLSHGEPGYAGPPNRKQNAVKLVCDIDQVFPVPEVSIYKLAKLDGSHPDKLGRLDTKIERDSVSGLYHVQVTSLLDDDELQMKYGQNEPVYFECLIALTNLELSKYADNKRSLIYRPGFLTKNPLSLQTSNGDDTEPSNGARGPPRACSRVWLAGLSCLCWAGALIAGGRLGTPMAR